MDPADLDLLLAALDSHDDAIAVVDRSGAIRYANTAAQQRVDTSLEVALGRRFSELGDRSAYFAEHHAFYAIVDEVLGEVMATGLSHSDDDAGRVATTGDSLPVSSRMHPVRHHGEVVGAVWIVRDQVQSSSLMFRRAAVAMSHVSRNRMVREANDALLHLVGRSEQDVRGKPFLDLIHPDDVPLAAPVLEAVLERRGGAGTAEVRFLRADGTSGWAELSIAPNGMGGEGGPGNGGACAILQDITARVELQRELEAAQERLRRLAHHDPLTGLPNRALLADELAAAQERATASGGHVAVLFIDLDAFKLVNDSAGHETGDRLLVQAGERLRHLLRPDDLAARIGGDEFVVCCTDLPADEAGARVAAGGIAERVRAVLGEPFEIDGRRWTVGASIGMAMSRAGALPPDALLREADAEMYKVKAGR